MVDERPYREWSLDRRGDKIVFYEGPLTKGVVITASEAEIYLSGDEGAWFDVIHGRERTEPRRPYFSELMKRSASLPKGLQIAFILGGFLFFANARRSESPVLEFLFSIIAVLLVSLGVCTLIFARWTARKRGD